MRQILGSLGLFFVVVGAFGCPDGDDFARAGFSEVYARIHAATLARLQEMDPRIVGVRPFDAQETVVKVEIDYGNEKKVLVHTYFMGFADKHLLSYDVQVDEGFRERGLSKLMLAHFLLTRPDVAHAEAQLLETSEVAFLVAVQEKRTGRDLIDRVKRIDPNGPEVTALRRSFIRANIRFSEVDDVAKTRENILIAALDNPLTHAQIAVGMGRLKRVIVAMPDNEERNLDIRLEFDRGVLAEGDHGKVEVILAELGSHETIRGPSVPFLRLLPSGLIQQGIEQLLR